MRFSKGQYTIVALIATLMVVLAFSRLYPIILDSISISKNVSSEMNQTDVYTNTLLDMVPFFILLAIVLTTIFVTLPTKQT